MAGEVIEVDVEKMFIDPNTYLDTKIEALIVFNTGTKGRVRQGNSDENVRLTKL